MKKFILFIVALFFICCTKTPTETDMFPLDVIVNIETQSTDSLIFSGQYGNSNTSIDVDGILYPDQYQNYNTIIENKNDEVFANFKKEQVMGTLIVRIIITVDKNGHKELEVKKEASTSASYGSVYISWKPD